MVSNKNSKKAKKPVETTLGKAPALKPKENEPDVSHLRKPIGTSICGVKQVLNLLKTATEEVKNFVMFECDIMYECRICRTIFRSLANFVLHKRTYCKDKFSALDYANNNKTYQETIADGPEANEVFLNGNNSLSKVIDKLHVMHQAKEMAEKVLGEDLTLDPSRDNVKSMDDREEKASNSNEIALEKIDTNSSCVFQTLIKNDEKQEEQTTMKSEVMEIHKMLQNDVPVLDPDGKVCSFTSSQVQPLSIFPKADFKCTECRHRFSTQKSFFNHIKCVHNPTRILYVCPTCKETFANPWCVYRHLLRVHRMTSKQVRRMREQINNGWIRRDEEIAVQKKKPEACQNNTDTDNQWINDIEGDKDFQMCAGCGKHFDRKAALHSHSQMCAKRLEVCNNIKENAKKKEEEEANEKAKLEKLAVSQKPALKGASKRKGQNILSYKRKPSVEGDCVVSSDDSVGKSDAQPHQEIVDSIEIDTDESIKSENLNSNELNNKEEPKTIVKEETSSSSSDVILHEENQDFLSNNMSVSRPVVHRTRRQLRSSVQEKPIETIQIVDNDDDDVIFVSECPSKDDKSVEESSDASFSVDLSNLSYNNPLKCKEQKTKRPIKRKIRTGSGDRKVVKQEKRDRNFITRAGPYMNQTKLLCIPCGQTFKSSNQLLWHMSAHFAWYRYQCSKCSFISFNKYDCMLHARKQHKLRETDVTSYILPLPSWKTILMSHEFRLLKDCKDLKGSLTDEIIIGIDETQDQSTEATDSGVEGDAVLFGESPKNSEETEATLLPENQKMLLVKSGLIDIQEAANDFQILPEPMELTMPADLSEVIRTCNSDEVITTPDESVPAGDCQGEDSNDDWELPQETKEGSGDSRPKSKAEPVCPSTRPSRIRTKPKLNEDFLYYDTRANC